MRTQPVIIIFIITFLWWGNAKLYDKSLYVHVPMLLLPLHLYSTIWSSEEQALKRAQKSLFTARIARTLLSSSAPPHDSFYIHTYIHFTSHRTQLVKKKSWLRMEQRTKKRKHTRNDWHIYKSRVCACMLLLNFKWARAHALNWPENQSRLFAILTTAAYYLRGYVA